MIPNTNNKATKGQEDDSENLWNKILKEAIKSSSQTNHDANLIVIGEGNSGKRSVISAMEKFTGEKLNLESRNDNSIINDMKDRKVASSIDYKFLSIKNPDEKNMELAKINVWFVNEKCTEKLSQLILKKEHLQNLMVMVVLSLDEYWSTMDNLSKWFQYINLRISPAFSERLELKEMDVLKERLKDIVMNYNEPVRTDAGKLLNRKSEIDPENIDKLFIPEGVLDPNYGFPIVLVLNKSDHIIELRKQPNADQILEMLEYSLRKFAVSYAAPVIYTSVKTNSNIEVLHDYVNHLFFNIPFRHPSNICKDALFVPMGYDNLDIINGSYSTIKEKSYDAVITPPVEDKVEKDIEINVKPHQEFLNEVKQSLGTAQKSKPKIKAPEESDIKKGTELSKDKEKSSRGIKKRGKFDKEQTNRILSLLGNG